LTDLYAHRAQVPVEMVCKSKTAFNDKSVFDVKTYANSKVGKECIKSGLTAKSVYDKINGTSGIPMIRLKDYIADPIPAELKINNTTYAKNTISNNRAFEDNPYFWTYRYSCSVSALKSKISGMAEDNGDTTTYTLSTYASTPLK